MVRGRSLVFAALLASAGCAGADSIACLDGDGQVALLCPGGTQCWPLDASFVCASADAIAACHAGSDPPAAALPDETACGDGGRCHSGACLPVVCGDGRVDDQAGEQCDTAMAGTACSVDCRSNLTCPNGIVDDVGDHHEQCDDNNPWSFDGCDQSCHVENATWTQAASDQPQLRIGAAVAYDLSRDRVVLFGGTPDTFGPDLQDTWELDGASWFQIPAVPPDARHATAMAYDSRRHVTILFGGARPATGGPLADFSDTWSWDGSRWTRLSPGSSPDPIAGHAMAYDAALDQILMVRPDGQAWSWSGDAGTWTRGADVAPCDRLAMAYDPVRARSVLYACSSGPFEYEAGMWVPKVDASGPPGDLAAPAMAYDASAHAVILVSSEAKAAWTWSGAWAPAPRPGLLAGGIVAATLPERGDVVLFGVPANKSPPDATEVLHGDTWTPARVAKFGAPFAAFDIGRDRVVVYDGNAAASVPATWELVHDTWIPVDVASPAGRAGVAMAYDGANVVMFGGVDPAPLAETWIFDGHAWTSGPTDGPSPRSGAAMAYDPIRDVAILFGGFGAGQVPLADTWQWKRDAAHPTGAWTLITPSAGAPPPRADQAMGFDPASMRILMFGGDDNSGGELADTWAWDDVASTWTNVTPMGAPGPAGRTLAKLEWNPARARAVLFGGLLSNSGFELTDTWEWTGTAWVELAVVGPEVNTPFAMTAAPDGSGLVAVTRSAVIPPLSSLPWHLRFDSGDPHDRCIDRADLDGDTKAGCDDPDCWPTCRPRCAPHMPCDLAAPHCGDGTCDADRENCRICPEDCPTCE